MGVVFWKVQKKPIKDCKFKLKSKRSVDISTHFIKPLCVD